MSAAADLQAAVEHLRKALALAGGVMSKTQRLTLRRLESDLCELRNRAERADELRADARALDDGMSPAQVRELHEAADAMDPAKNP